MNPMVNKYISELDAEPDEPFDLEPGIVAQTMRRTDTSIGEYDDENPSKDAFGNDKPGPSTAGMSTYEPEMMMDDGMSMGDVSEDPMYGQSFDEFGPGYDESSDPMQKIDRAALREELLSRLKARGEASKEYQTKASDESTNAKIQWSRRQKGL